MKDNNTSKYKYACELKSDMSDYGKYEQYINLEEAYHTKDESDDMAFGLFENKESDIRAVPGLTIIAGMTGHGKSMLGNSLAYKAVRNGLNVLYITLEVNKEDMFYQMLSIESYIDGSKGESKAISHSHMKKRSLSPEQEEYLFKELWPSFKNMEGNLHILSEFDFDVGDTASLQSKMMEVEDYSKAHYGRGIDMIIVDYIQLFKIYSRGSGTGEYSVLTNWVNDFRKLSLNYLGENREIPIIILSQLNRDAWVDDKQRQKQMAKNNMKVEYIPSGCSNKRVNVPDIVLSISQIAGCTEIAKAAKQIIAIYSDESYKASKQCLVALLKNRNGGTHMDPAVTYMNPEYYIVGFLNEYNESYKGDYDSLFEDDIVPISSFEGGSSL